MIYFWSISVDLTVSLYYKKQIYLAFLSFTRIRFILLLVLLNVQFLWKLFLQLFLFQTFISVVKSDCFRTLCKSRNNIGLQFFASLRFLTNIFFVLGWFSTFHAFCIYFSNYISNHQQKIYHKRRGGSAYVHDSLNSKTKLSLSIDSDGFKSVRREIMSEKTSSTNVNVQRKPPNELLEHFLIILTNFPLNTKSSSKNFHPAEVFNLNLLDYDINTMISIILLIFI